MKLTHLAITGLLATAFVLPAQADNLTAGKQGATFVGATAAGAALGGPVGMLVGAITGAWYAEQLEAAGQLEQREQ